jgi:hypothetical protein
MSRSAAIRMSTACALHGYARGSSTPTPYELRKVRKRKRAAAVENAQTSLDLSHLRRETRTALELAVVALAPSDLIERLASAAGLLEAITELPSNSAPVLTLAPQLSKRAKSVLEDWKVWEMEHLSKLKA